MNEHLAFYLLLGLPASITIYVLMKAKGLLTFPIIYALWPGWIVWLMVKEFVWLNQRRCGYCGAFLPNNKDMIDSHVQHCPDNPLVQRIAELEDALTNAQLKYMTAARAKNKLEAQIKEMEK